MKPSCSRCVRLTVEPPEKRVLVRRLAHDELGRGEARRVLHHLPVAPAQERPRPLAAAGVRAVLDDDLAARQDVRARRAAGPGLAPQRAAQKAADAPRCGGGGARWAGHCESVGEAQRGGSRRLFGRWVGAQEVCSQSEDGAEAAQWHTSSRGEIFPANRKAVGTPLIPLQQPREKSPAEIEAQHRLLSLLQASRLR